MNSNGSDPLVVLTEELRASLAEDFDHYDWVNFMADELGMDPRNLYRKLYLQKYITLSVVDRWLTKMELQQWLSNGTIKVVPNPRWTQERWFAYMEERGCV